MQTFFNDFLNLYDQEKKIALLHLDRKSKMNEFVSISEFSQRWLNNEYREEKNVYFTPNCLGVRSTKTNTGKLYHGFWRDSQHLETLECLYADLDLKDSKYNLDQEETLNYLKENVFGYELPAPTIAINSGHGLHLYWKINSLHYKNNLDKWNGVQSYIHEVLKNYGSDTAVTHDTVRVLRVDGSINQKAGKIENRCVALDYTGFVYDIDEIIANYDLSEYVAIYEATRPLLFPTTNTKDKEPKKKTTRKSVSKKAKNDTFREKLYLNGGFGSTDNIKCGAYTRLYISRMKDLAHLVLSREKGHHIEICLFLFRYYHLMVYGDKELAIAKMLELINQSGIEYNVEELLKQTASAEKYADGLIKCGGDKKGVYEHLNITCDKLVEMLKVEDYEMEHLDAIRTTAVKMKRAEEKKALYREEKRKEYAEKLEAEGKLTKKQQKAERQIKIATLLLQGKTHSEIAEILEISTKTIQRDVKTIETETWQNEYGKRVQEAIAEIGTIKENVSKIALVDMKIVQTREYCENIKKYLFPDSGHFEKRNTC